MKKKFLSSLLFAALVGGAVSTFTACKDYDDDISSLRELVDKNTAAIEAINKLIASGSVITDVTPFTNGNGGVTVKLSNGKTFDIANGATGAKGEDGAKGRDADVWKIGEDGYWYKNDVKTEYYALGTKGNDGAKGEDGKPGNDGAKGEDGKPGNDGCYYVPNPETGCFDKVTPKGGENGSDKVERTTIAYLSNVTNEGITAVLDKENLTLYGVEGGEGDNKMVVISLKSQLKSLVFEPDFYYQGIEALDFLTVKYNEQTVKPVNADEDYSTDAPLAGDLFTMAPDLAATYHLNPTNAKMVEDIAAYSFIAYNKNYTRSKEEAVSKHFNIVKADLEDAGYVTVHATYNGDVVKSIAKDEQVTVLALQYTDKENNDAVVTSDYAAIRADVHQNLVLNNPKMENQHSRGVDTETESHLFTKAADAIKAEPQATVVWNEEGVDMRQYVNTHYFGIGANGELDEETCYQWDKNAEEGLVEKSGFKYSFELVGYMSGDNKTSQSAHACFASDGYTLRPQMPKADGKQDAFGGEQNRALIGRMPLVRVLLTDTINGKIAAVGYIKVKITETQENPTAFTLELNSDSVYTLACQGNITALETSWNQIEHNILAKLNLSKEEFEAAYELSGDPKDADQYEKNTIDAELRKENIGVVSQTTTDKDGNMTEVLKWVVADNQAYTIFGTEKKTSVNTYIRYQLKEGKTGPYNYFYVKLVWTPKEVNVTPETKFGNKIKQYWYAANNATAGSGYDDIHGNVEVPGTLTNSCAYQFDITNTLNGGKLAVSPLVAPYDKLNPDMVHGVYFKGGKCGDVTLGAADNGKKLVCGLETVAEIDPATGIVTYAQTDKAKELLNMFGHKELDKTVTANMVVKANLCYGIDVPVADSTFNVKFLRPIDVNNAKCGPFEDAVDNGSTKDLTMDFVDWRDIKFSSVKAPSNYYRYYEVSAIELDIDKATSDINGSEANLKQVAPNIELTFNKPTSANILNGKFGTVTYKNNGTTVGNFKIWIPGTVTYKWGKVAIKVECSVAKTMNNSNKK